MYPFPEGVKPDGLVPGCDLYLVTDGKMLRRKRGVMDTRGRIIIPLELSVRAVVTALHQKIIRVVEPPPRKASCKLYDLEGHPLPGGPWLEAVDLGEKRVGLRALDGAWAVADAAARPLTWFQYRKIHDFSEGRAVAERPGAVDVLDPSGAVVATVTGTSDELGHAGPFSDGLAVFGYADGTKGALRPDGSVAFRIEASLLERAAHGFFRYATSGVRRGLHGLLDSRGRVVVPAGERENLDPLAADTIRFGRMVAREWSSTEFGREVRHVQAKLVWGLLDGSGRQIVPRVFADVGPESEGLRAFIRYEDDWCVFGYMDAAWNPAFTVARDAHQGTIGEAFRHGKVESRLFLEPVSQLMEPFRDGRAAVWIRQVTERIAGESSDKKGNPAGRWVDRAGNTLPGRPQPQSQLGDLDIPESEEDRQLAARLSPYGLIPKRFPNRRKSVQRVLGDMWLETFADGEMAPLLSSLETTAGFFCGLHEVTTSAGKCHSGWADPHGQVLVPPQFDETGGPFRANRTWARTGRDYFALSRPMRVEG
jgi:hypothetical protein